MPLPRTASHTRPAEPAPTQPLAPDAAWPEPAQTDARHDLGRRGEDLAAKFLASRGFEVIERNWRSSSRGSAATASTCAGSAGGRIKVRGELDIVAWDGAPWAGGTLCFVEVKARASGAWGTPGQAVDAAKQRQIVRLAQAFLALHGASEPRFWEVACRFDVVEVWLPEGQTPRIALHQAAFDASPAPPRGF